MFAYFLRRILQMIPTILGVILMLFLLFNFFAGDPAQILAGKMPNPERIAAIRKELGLDEPWFVQLWVFFKQVISFDYGRSWTTNEPVGQILSARLPATLTIMLPVWVLEAAIAVVLALGVAYVRGTLTDRVVMAICTASMSISLLLYAVVGQWVFGSVLGWAPVQGWGDSLATNLSTYAWLPIMLILFVAITPSLRLYRSFVVEEINQDYVRTARAKGVSDNRIMYVHVLRNAAIPIVTNMALSLPGLVVGSFIIEQIFSIPGIGREVIVAVEKSDFPVIKAITMMVAFVTMFANLFVDVLYKVLDPRVELK
ncbi:peptide/nickel transport system permease protein [Chitinivorax tropicus]|uniref:Peptide/nickel transport system permease protein n=1 Tax=Chitinivorax tropicus TaxID=714531 RepID=A0A840MN91_9PROT|nr:ABC transporter permease [Chitinivorax tropicus]MBB5020108.1 peptide/nickel transport system permease protein [Chitinivorax tropicus]